MRQEKVDVIREYLQGYDRKVLLDYGYGNSPYRSVYVDQVQQYSRADLSGTPDIDVELGSKAEIPLEPGSADVVLSSHVLEHVPDPVATHCQILAQFVMSFS